MLTAHTEIYRCTMSRFKYSEQDTPNTHASVRRTLTTLLFFSSSSFSSLFFFFSLRANANLYSYDWVLVHFCSGDDAMLLWMVACSRSVYLSNKINGRNKVINFIFGTLSNRIFYRLINDGQIIIGKVFDLCLFVLLLLSIHFFAVVLKPKKKFLRFFSLDTKNQLFSTRFVPCTSSKSKLQTHQTISRNEDIKSSKNKRRRIYLIEMEHFYIYTHV